jgi:two-component system chemotaxis response regulator CheB
MRPTKVEAVVIGVSTGGPNVLEQLVPALLADLRVPVLMVQHMPPVFTALLAERLDTKSRLQVREAQGGETIGPGQLWIAPGDRHLEIVQHGATVRTALTDDPPENSCRPAVDVLFRSAVAVYGGNILALVLTGMGQDGLRGCEQIAAAGGRIVIQDETTSVVWGMPGAIARAGLAHCILPADRLAAEINKTVAAPVGAR